MAGTLLAAPMLIAMGTYLTHADLGVHTGTQLGSLHLGPSALPQLLMPYVYGQVNADPHSVDLAQGRWLPVGDAAAVRRARSARARVVGGSS